MPTYDDASLLSHALSSEKAYFRLGAREWGSAETYVAIVPGLEHLPAASVCILEAGIGGGPALAAAIEAAETRFTASAVVTARIYTAESTDGFNGVMEQRGYRRRVENIHAFHPLPAALPGSPESGWRPVRTDADWREKAAIHALPSTASDGYEISPEEWVSLERRKSETGELSFWLYSDAGRAVATTGLMRCADGVVRIKNFFVRADCRGKGVGKAAVGNMLRQLAARGDEAVVVLSIAGSVGERLYHSAGARDIGCIYEWARNV
jgi:GNAT superfamily N-acetyltransferase